MSALLPACSATSSERGAVPDARDARRAAERWLAAVAAGDSSATRAGASCRVPGPAFRGATILRVNPPASLSPRTLDSVATAFEEEARRTAVELAAGWEETADSLWLRRDAAARAAELCRNALRAVTMSRAAPGGSSFAALAGHRAGTPSDSTLRACRVRVRIRWGGPLVGPEAVDREHVLRALAAPGGSWVVYSILARDRDPAILPF